MRKQKTSGWTSLALALGGCAHSAPVAGLLYTDVEHGLTATANQTGTRSGEACATSYLGLVALGDASIETARRNGAIAMISAVDRRTTSYLGVYTRSCTLVRGR